MRLTLPADGVRAQSPPKKYAIKNHKVGRSFFLEVGGGVCVSCQPIYRSLPCSILFLNFLYKRLREGKRRVSEQGEDERREREREKKSAIMDFILNPLPISQTDSSPKKRHRVQKRTFCNRGSKKR